MIFRLWAPKATTAAIAIDGEQIPMTASPDGWWTAELAAAGPSIDYVFSLDGGPPLPDPRSGW